MAMTGGIGYEIDQLTELGVPELMRRQSVDPQLKYALALQQATKLVEAAARERDMSQQMPMPANVVGQMETSLAKRLAPGVQMQGQRSQRMQNRAAMGLPGQAAPNLARMAGGGIVGYQEGGDVEGKSTQAPMMGDENQRRAPYLDPALEKFLIELEALNAQKDAAFPQEKDLFRQKIQDLIDTTSPRVKRLASDSAFGLPKKSGMAMGGVVGYEKGGPVDMDALLDALMIAESGGDPKAVSRAGAEGAYQIMPATAADPGFGVSPMEGDRFDPKASRAFARQYLQAMLDRYDGDVEAALIAYNAGAGNADKFIAAGRDYDVLPQTMQTQPYVSKIMGQVEREDRRRDFQMGGDRTISTTAPESYTEKRRRERLEKQEAALASLYPPVAMEEAEMYEPNLPDALAVAQAMDSLKGDAEEAPVIAGFPTREETDKAFTDAGLSGYGDGSRIRQRARTGPEVEEVEEETRELTFGGGNNITTTLPESFTEQRTRERREANAPAEGIAGYFQNIGRQQQLRKDNFRKAVPGAEAAVARAEQEKADGGAGYLRRLARMQAAAEERKAAEESRGLRYLTAQARMQNQLESIDPAVEGVKGFDQGGVVGLQTGGTAEDKMRELGIDPDYGVLDTLKAPLEFLGDKFKEGSVAASEFLGDVMPGGGSVGRERMAEQEFAEAVKAAYPDASAGEVRAITTIAMAKGEEPPPPPSAATLTEADIFRRDAPAALVSAIDANEGKQTALRAMFPDAPEMTAQERAAERARIARGGGDRPTRRSAGLAGLLDKIGGTQGLLNVAETLGRGAGASKGFEAAKIVEESAKARQIAQARQDRKEALEAELGVRREQISATRAAAEAAAGARLSQAQAKIVADYMGGIQFGLDVKALAERQGKSPDDPSVAQDAVRAFLNRLGQIQNSVGGMGGLETQQGLSAEQRANLEAFVAS